MSEKQFRELLVGTAEQAVQVCDRILHISIFMVRQPQQRRRGVLCLTLPCPDI